MQTELIIIIAVSTFFAICTAKAFYNKIEEKERKKQQQQVNRRTSSPNKSKDSAEATEIPVNKLAATPVPEKREIDIASIFEPVIENGQGVTNIKLSIPDHIGNTESSSLNFKKHDHLPDEFDFEVKGLKYRPKTNIEYAMRMKLGTYIELDHDNDNEYDEHAIKVYAGGFSFIGYVEKELSQKVHEYLYEIKDCRVISKSNDSIPIIKARVYFEESPYLKQIKKDLEETSGDLDILNEADRLKRTETDKALEMALPIAEKDYDMRGKFICCQCYREKKDYQSELVMVNRLLSTMESRAPEGIPVNDFYDKYDTIVRRKNTVISRIESIKRKKA